MIHKNQFIKFSWKGEHPISKQIQLRMESKQEKIRSLIHMLKLGYDYLIKKNLISFSREDFISSIGYLRKKFVEDEVSNAGSKRDQCYNYDEANSNSKEQSSEKQQSHSASKDNSLTVKQTTEAKLIPKAFKRNKKESSSDSESDGNQNEKSDKNNE